MLDGVRVYMVDFPCDVICIALSSSQVISTCNPYHTTTPSHPPHPLNMNLLTISTTIVMILASFAIAAPFQDRPVQADCGMQWNSACKSHPRDSEGEGMVADCATVFAVGAIKRSVDGQE
jgi:hypothetical protein